MHPLLKNELSLRVFGLDNLKGVDAPVVFFSNHSSHLDATLILTHAPRRVAGEDRGGRRARLLLRRVVAPGVHRARVRRVPDRSVAWRPRRRGQGARADRGRMEPGRVPRGNALAGRARAAVPSRRVPALPGARRRRACRSRSSARIRRCRRVGSGRRPADPTVTLRYGAPLYPIEGETHQDLSRRMAQAVAQLFDEDRSTWWDSLQRARTRARRRRSPVPKVPSG